MADKRELLDFEKIAKSAEEGLQVLSDKGKEYADIMKKVKLAMDANAAATKVLNKLEESNALQLMATNGGLTIRQTLMGILNGQITVATAATGLWAKAQTGLNAAISANPIGFAVAAVAAFAEGMFALDAVIGDNIEQNYRMSDGQKEMINSCKEATNALIEQKEARTEAVQSIDMEFDGYESLMEELKSITDENGKVKAGYEDRAKVVTGLLSDALGIEISMTDNVIDNYKETISTMEELIVQKKADALITSMQGEMADAYKKSKEAVTAYKEAQKALEEQQKKVAEAEEAYRQGGPKQKQALDQAIEDQKKMEETLEESKNAMQALSTEVNNYDDLIEAKALGDSAKIEEAMNALVTSYTSYSAEALEASEETRLEMYNQANQYVEDMKLVQDGTVAVADSVYQNMANAALNSINEFNKLPGGMAQGIAEIGPEASAAMASALMEANITGKLGDEGTAAMENLVIAVSNSNEDIRTAVLGALQPMLSEADYKALEMRIKGEKIGSETAEGIGSQEQNVNENSEKLQNSAEGVLNTADGKTPGKNFGEGFAKGIGNAIDSVIKAAKNLAGKALSALKKKLGINSPSKEAAQLGKFTGAGFVDGLQNQIPQVKKASEDLAASALQHMDVQGYLAKMRSAMSMEKATIGANLTSRVVHEVVMGNQSDFMNVGDKIEALQKHIDGIKIQLLLEGKTYIDKREAGYILAPEINKRLGEFAELKGRGNNSK